jgi:hypothetical protein
MERKTKKGFIRFTDADPKKTLLENLIAMSDELTYQDFLIGRAGTPEEFYIDERTTGGLNTVPKVFPVAENDLFFWYICPFCQQIHIESKRILNLTDRTIWTACPYRMRLMQYIQIQMEADAEWGSREDVDSIMEAEWRYMNAYNRKAGK